MFIHHHHHHGTTQKYPSIIVLILIPIQIFRIRIQLRAPSTHRLEGSTLDIETDPSTTLRVRVRFAGSGGFCFLRFRLSVFVLLGVLFVSGAGSGGVCRFRPCSGGVCSNPFQPPPSLLLGFCF
ncbi:hypothetical protein P8452_58486 [Trifolium repens]|nr:hypothetical protein P8452_58486 [Trifolium repens]